MTPVVHAPACTPVAGASQMLHSADVDWHGAAVTERLVIDARH
jgi:hypothetical protein